MQQRSGTERNGGRTARPTCAQEKIKGALKLLVAEKDIVFFVSGRRGRRQRFSSLR
jgi:hypothetical protein